MSLHYVSEDVVENILAAYLDPISIYNLSIICKATKSWIKYMIIPKLHDKAEISFPENKITPFHAQHAYKMTCSICKRGHNGRFDNVFGVYAHQYCISSHVVSMATVRLQKNSELRIGDLGPGFPSINTKASVFNEKGYSNKLVWYDNDGVVPPKFTVSWQVGDPHRGEEGVRCFLRKKNGLISIVREQWIQKHRNLYGGKEQKYKNDLERVRNTKRRRLDAERKECTAKRRLKLLDAVYGAVVVVEEIEKSSIAGDYFAHKKSSSTSLRKIMSYQESQSHAFIFDEEAILKQRADRQRIQAEQLLEEEVRQAARVMWMHQVVEAPYRTNFKNIAFSNAEFYPHVKTKYREQPQTVSNVRGTMLLKAMERYPLVISADRIEMIHRLIDNKNLDKAVRELSDIILQ